MSRTRALWIETACRASWRDDMRAASLMFAGSLVFLMTLGVL